MCKIRREGGFAPPKVGLRAERLAICGRHRLTVSTTPGHGSFGYLDTLAMSSKQLFRGIAVTQGDGGDEEFRNLNLLRAKQALSR